MQGGPIGCIKNEWTDELHNNKKVPQKTTKVYDPESFAWLRKTTSQHFAK